MAKKQKRITKHEPNSVFSSDRGESCPSTSDFDAPLSNRQLVICFAVIGGFVLYLIGFLFVDTEVGRRFGTYLALLLRPSIYWAYWTGSPAGNAEILDRLPILAGTLFHFALAYGIGYLAIDRLLVFPMNSTEKSVLSVGIGLAILSTYTLLIGWFQILSWKQFLVLPPFAIGCFGYWQKFLSKSQDPEPDSLATKLTDRRHWTDHAVWMAIPFGLFILMGSMLPPWEFDVREYHLQVPKEWYQAGGISFLSHNVYGNMPLGTELQALFAMLYSFGDDDWWWGCLIGKTVSGCYAIMCGIVLFCIGQRMFGRFAGTSAVLIYLSMPWVTANSIIGYNESSMAFFMLAALLSFLICLRINQKPDAMVETTDQEHILPAKSALLIGMFLGGAVACKYTAVPFVFFPAFVLAALTIGPKSTLSKTITALGWLLFGCLLVSGGWFAKNWYLCGNPVYPLLDSLFASGRSEMQIDQWSRAHSPGSLIPSSNEMYQILGSLCFSYKWLSPLLFPIALSGLLNRNRFLVAILIAYLVYGFGLWLIATHRLERFLLPLVPIACLLAGAGLSWLDKKTWRFCAVGVLVFGVSVNGLFTFSRLVGDVRILASLEDLDSRKLDAKDYYHPQDEVSPLNHLTPAIAWLNKNAPDSNVLFYGECRPLTAEFAVIYNTCFDSCETWGRLADGNDQDVHQRLAKDGIDYLLVNASELSRFENTYGYNVDHPGHSIVLTRIVELAESSTVLKRVDLRQTVNPNTGVVLFSVEPLNGK